MFHNNLMIVGDEKMPLCSNCKAEYIRGKRICSYCGEELYKGLLTNLSEDDNIFNQLSWIKLTNVNTDNDADILIKQLSTLNVPAVKRSGDIPFEDVGVFQPGSIDIYVPQGMEKKAQEFLS